MQTKRKRAVRYGNPPRPRPRCRVYVARAWCQVPGARCMVHGATATVRRARATADSSGMSAQRRPCGGGGRPLRSPSPSPSPKRAAAHQRGPHERTSPIRFRCGVSPAAACRRRALQGHGVVRRQTRTFGHGFSRRCSASIGTSTSRDADVSFVEHLRAPPGCLFVCLVLWFFDPLSVCLFVWCVCLTPEPLLLTRRCLTAAGSAPPGV